MSARRALQALALTALCTSAASSAEIASSGVACLNAPLAIQVDQMFEKRDSYTVAGQEYVPFARQFGGMRSINVTRRTHGEAQVTVPLTFEGRLARGSAGIVMEADDHIRARTRSCSLKRVFAVKWTLNGTVSDQCTMDLTVVRDWVEQPAERVCNVDVLGRFAGFYPPIAETWQVSLKAEHGASVKREVGNFAAKDVSTLTVVRTVPAQ